MATEYGLEFVENQRVIAQRLQSRVTQYVTIEHQEGNDTFLIQLGVSDLGKLREASRDENIMKETGVSFATLLKQFAINKDILHSVEIYKNGKLNDGLGMIGRQTYLPCGGGYAYSKSDLFRNEHFVGGQLNDIGATPALSEYDRDKKCRMTMHCTNGLAQDPASGVPAKTEFSQFGDVSRTTRYQQGFMNDSADGQAAQVRYRYGTTNVQTNRRYQKGKMNTGYNGEPAFEQFDRGSLLYAQYATDGVVNVDLTYNGKFLSRATCYKDGQVTRDITDPKALYQFQQELARILAENKAQAASEAFGDKLKVKTAGMGL